MSDGNGLPLGQACGVGEDEGRGGRRRIIQPAMPTTSAVNQEKPECKNLDDGWTEVVNNSEASTAPRAST